MGHAITKRTSPDPRLLIYSPPEIIYILTKFMLLMGYQKRIIEKEKHCKQLSYNLIGVKTIRDTCEVLKFKTKTKHS